MKVGLIGLGRHGIRYAQHLLAQQSPAQLVAICRRDPLQGKTFAQSHKLRFHQTYQALIDDPEVEAVIVVTPPSLTRAIAQAAIRQRKPLLIEKPLAITAKDARHIVESAAQGNVPIMTAHTLRYDATVTKLHETSCAVGAWQYLSMTARLERRLHSTEEINAWNGRGALLEFGIHLLDLARVLTAEEIYEVYCEMRSTNNPRGPEDQAWGRLTTTSGLNCLLDISRVSHSRMTNIQLIGETGQVSANWSTATCSLQRDRNLPEEQKFSRTPTIHYVLQDFVQSLENGKPMPITGEDGLRAIEIAEACYKSADTKQPVILSHE